MKTEKRLNIHEVNELSSDEFIAMFGNVVENCALCAATVFSYRPFQDFEDLRKRFEMFLKQQHLSGKSGVIRLYPDIAGKRSESGDLSADSKKERAMVGLDALIPAERQKMTDWNARYREKFNFPFVVCVRENKKCTIFRALEQRFYNSVDAEIEFGLNEVMKICTLRLRDLVEAERMLSNL